MSDVIVNRVAQSSLITLDLEKWVPAVEIVDFDLKPHLFMELILKEKDFRQSMKELDWAQFTGKVLAVNCSADAIIPLWAYMLITSYAQPYTQDILFGTVEEVKEKLLLRKLEEVDVQEFENGRVVVKGCGKLKIPESAYILITRLLTPVVKSLMFGEPCSTVPVFKAKK